MLQSEANYPTRYSRLGCNESPGPSRPDLKLQASRRVRAPGLHVSSREQRSVLRRHGTGAAPTSFPRLPYALAEVAEGSRVAIEPEEQELTTSEAANFLNVSRPYLSRLLKGRKIPHRKQARTAACSSGTSARIGKRCA